MWQDFSKHQSGCFVDCESNRIGPAGTEMPPAGESWMDTEMSCAYLGKNCHPRVAQPK